MITTIISYCTNDFRFIGKCIEEAKKFSSEILIVVSDHFFDGSLENKERMEMTYQLHPECRFIEFAYQKDRLYSPYHQVDPTLAEWPAFWAATARYIGAQYAKEPYLFFLDSDEIVEGDKMARWVQSEEPLRCDVMRLAAYLYALRPTLRAKKVVNLPLWVKRSVFAPLTLFNPLERIGAYLSHLGSKREEVVGLDGLPMVHHYSWVRTKEECLQKVKTWSHRDEEKWLEIIEEAFSGTSKDLFKSSLEFEEIQKEPYFDPFKFKNVEKIGEKDLRKKEMMHALL